MTKRDSKCFARYTRWAHGPDAGWAVVQVFVDPDAAFRNPAKAAKQAARRAYRLTAREWMPVPARIRKGYVYLAAVRRAHHDGLAVTSVEAVQHQRLLIDHPALVGVHDGRERMMGWLRVQCYYSPELAATMSKQGAALRAMGEAYMGVRQWAAENVPADLEWDRKLHCEVRARRTKEVHGRFSAGAA